MPPGMIINLIIKHLLPRAAALWTPSPPGSPHKERENRGVRDGEREGPRRSQREGLQSGEQTERLVITSLDGSTEERSWLLWRQTACEVISCRNKRNEEEATIQSWGEHSKTPHSPTTTSGCQVLSSSANFCLLYFTFPSRLMFFFKINWIKLREHSVENWRRGQQLHGKVRRQKVPLGARMLRYLIKTLLQMNLFTDTIQNPSNGTDLLSNSSLLHWGNFTGFNGECQQVWKSAANTRFGIKDRNYWGRVGEHMCVTSMTGTMQQPIRNPRMWLVTWRTGLDHEMCSDFRTSSDLTVSPAEDVCQVK